MHVFKSLRKKARSLLTCHADPGSLSSRWKGWLGQAGSRGRLSERLSCRCNRRSHRYPQPTGRARSQENQKGATRPLPVMPRGRHRQGFALPSIQEENPPETGHLIPSSHCPYTASRHDIHLPPRVHSESLKASILQVTELSASFPP